MHELKVKSSCKNSKTFEVSEFRALQVYNNFLNHMIQDVIIGSRYSILVYAAYTSGQSWSYSVLAGVN
jgi:hypothetical protein